MNRLTAAVLGGSGYAGGELLRLLAGHPHIEVTSVGRRSVARAAGADLRLPGGPFEPCRLGDAASAGATVCFSCLPSGELRELVDVIDAEVVVDLSDDFRGVEGWLYGLTEYGRDGLKAAARIANPGCFPTAALLALIPFARLGAIAGPVIVDAISGVSGAGRKAEHRLLFSELHSSVAAYGTTEHRHVPEMERALLTLGELDATVSFTPHLAPMARGLLVTVRASLTNPLDDRRALEVLEEAFALEPFVSVVEDWPATKAVCGSNGAIVAARVDARNELLICSCAIDNLGKGAAGQALQNANVALGLEETAGLDRMGMWP
jgi:N-acetyl-gamma-glutamyl-phosphate reductase